MNEIKSKIVKIDSLKMPPDTDFIENKLKELKINPVRWSIVEVENNTLTLCVSGEIL